MKTLGTKRNSIRTTIALVSCMLMGGTALAELKNTALVITDPQNDFLSPEGVAWGMVGKSVTENKTVDHIDELFKAAKANGIPVFVSPHYYYPTDHLHQGVAR